MSEQITVPSAPRISKEKLATLPPEDQRRILTAMRMLADVQALYLEGMQVAANLLEGKVPGGDVGMALIDFERSLRLAGNDMLKRPMRVAHAEAFRKGETRLDEEPWLMRTRIKATEARKAREERAREEKLKASLGPVADAVGVEEPEAEAGPRP